MLSKIRKTKLKSYFIVCSIFCVVYIGIFKTSFYESTASVTIKNLDEGSTASTLLGLVSGQSNNSTQDAMTLQEYLKSYEVYDKLDKKFDLTNYYKSDLDFLQKMYWFNSYEDYVILYNNHLNIVFDSISNISTISFLHKDNQKAKEIVEFLIAEAELKLNDYNKQSAAKQLSFVENETKTQKEALEHSIKELLIYQDLEKTIDPNTQAQTNTGLLSSLKIKLVESKATLEKISKYLTNNSFEIIDLKREILEIENSIKQLEKEQSGNEDKTLNKSIFEFEKLKSQVEFNTELYKQALLQLQSSQIEVNKDNKILQILVNPNLAQSYTEPKKIREIFTVLLVLGLIFGILSMIDAIIKDHRE